MRRGRNKRADRDRSAGTRRQNDAENRAKRRVGRPVGVLALCLGALACQDEVPTSVDNGLVPVSPITISVQLPFDSFSPGFDVFGGFGQSNRSTFGGVNGYAAQGFGDLQLEARTLARFGALPISAVVQDTTGATVTDTDLTYLSGFLTLVLDTTASVLTTDSLRITASTTSEAWDASTTTWTNAADSTGTVRAWTTPGGGAMNTAGSAVVAPGGTFDDGIRIFVDSATVASLSDTTDPTRGLVLSSQTEGSQVAFVGVALSVDVRPGSNPDTTVALAVPLLEQTFIYNPPPPRDSTVLQVGGAPAWRSVFSIRVPTELSGPEALCQAVGCPLSLSEGLVTSAILTLRTAGVPSSFAPRDSVRFDARPVLAPERLPKAPLGPPIGFLPVTLPPSYFTTQAGTDVDVPITGFVRGQLAGPNEDGTLPPATVALVASLEPSSLGFAAFQGLGAEGAPRIELVLTIPDALQLIR